MSRSGDDHLPQPTVTNGNTGKATAGGSTAAAVPAAVSDDVTSRDRIDAPAEISLAADEHSSITENASNTVDHKVSVAHSPTGAGSAAPEADAGPNVEKATDKPHAQAEAAPTAAPSLGSLDNLDLKALPKVAAEAAKQAGHAYASAGKEARTTVSALLGLRNKAGPPITLTVDQIAMVAFFLFLGFQLLLLPIFMPSAFRLVYSLVWGLLLGLGISFMFYYNKKRKTEVNELLGVLLGLKGVQLVAADIPSAINVSGAEKLEWLNSLVARVWPYVDKAVCNMIKEATAQAMPGVLQSLPVGLSSLVRSIGFKHLTFGSAPVRIESIWMDPDISEGLVMELSVKWCADPNITLAIEIPTGQKLCPRIMDISFVATLRVVLNPLVPRLPGFVAAMATMPKTPLINYRLDFGRALGGSGAALTVTPVINYFLRDVIDRMLVWPARVVVPILQETQQDTVEIQKLMRRQRGVLRVCVLRGKDLNGLGAAENALVTLTTDSEHTESTTEKAATVSEGLGERVYTVTWNETYYLLVQEPDSQTLRLEAFDTTPLRAAKALSVTGRRLVGRSLVKLNQVCRAESREPVLVQAHLGNNSWGTLGGPGKGYGKVMLQMTYFPFEAFTKQQVVEAQKGIITVRILGIRGLTPVGNSLSVFASINTTQRKRSAKSSACKTARKTWSQAEHMKALQLQVKQLEAAQERDSREGRQQDAEKKGELIAKLKEEIANQGSVAPVVTADYSLDVWNIHAFYNVTDTVQGTGEDNKIIISVKRETRTARSGAETLGTVSIPVSEVRNAYCHNPITGNSEYGLLMRDWDRSDPLGLRGENGEFGFPLEGASSGAKLFVAIRWAPCIEAAEEPPEDEQDNDESPDVNKPPSSVQQAPAPTSD